VKSIFRFKKFVNITIGILCILSVGSIALNGFKFGIDFTGGTIVEFTIPHVDPDISIIRKCVENTFGTQEFLLKNTSKNKFELRIGALVYDKIEKRHGREDESIVDQLRNTLASSYKDVSFDQVESIGPQVSHDLIQQSIIGLLFACVMILLYMTVRFQWKFSLSGVAVLWIDVLITCGLISLMGIELNLTIVASILTIIGYCINDTVVVYDRIRANFVRYSAIPIRDAISISVSETLSRSIITSFVTLLSVLGITLFSDVAIRNFAIVVGFGIIIGTFGSIFVAPSLLMLLNVRRIVHTSKIRDPLFYAS